MTFGSASLKNDFGGHDNHHHHNIYYVPAGATPTPYTYTLTMTITLTPKHNVCSVQGRDVWACAPRSQGTRTASTTNPHPQTRAMFVV